MATIGTYHMRRKAVTFIMTWIFGILAVLCAVYYAIIFIYSGFATSFSLVWVFFSVVFGLMAVGGVYYRHHPKQVPLWIPVSAVTLCAAGAIVFAVVEVLVFAGAASPPKPHLDYLIVLGARVRDMEISNSLQQRLDKAIEYVQENPDTILVLSGGQGKGESVAEAVVMQEYLVFNGVPAGKIMLETYSTSTVENIAYSRVAIENDQMAKKLEAKNKLPAQIPGALVIDEGKPLEIGVLTSDFHVFRAKQIAQKWGIPDIHGVSSDSDPVLFVHFCVRECVAILKDKLMGNM